MNTAILVGDCVKMMKYLPDGRVNCCVTSPPYFGLRDYGVDGQIGLEETPEQYISKLVEVFREVRRVLRDDGTLWVNIGDSYASLPRGGRKESPGVGATQAIGPIHRAVKWGSGGGTNFHWELPGGIKQKDLIGIPWMLAFALRADGWYLRQDIIWHKPNPMPESVRDRCTKAHEYIFLLSKSPKYYFDAEAIKEPATGRPSGNKGKSWGTNETRVRADGAGKVETTRGIPYAGAETRNRRSVWTVSTKPFKGAHFATFPPDLIEPCVLAGCPEGGLVLDPFGGSGTTGMVANQHGRNAILTELNPEYAEIATSRIASVGGEVVR